MNSAPECRERKSRTAVRLEATLAASVLAFVPAIASAQPASSVLPPTREEVTRPQPRPEAERAARLDVEGAVERAPCALDGPQFRDIRFTVRGAEFDGLQVVSATELAPAFSSLVGTEQPISVVCDIRDRAAAILRDAGYIAAVEVPEQRMTDGIVRFNVVMARLTQVRVRGDASGAERVIAGYLSELTKQPVFNSRDAERYLLLAGELPGYTVRLTLRPAGTTPGEVLGDVTVQRMQGYADVEIQNGGTEELGPWGALVRGQVYGLTGLADRTMLAVFATADLKEQQTLQAGHDFALGSEGLRLGAFATYGWANPSVELVDVRSKTLIATLQADYPFIRTLSHSLRGTLGFDLVNQELRLDSADFSRDRLRVAFARLAFDATDTDFEEGRTFAEPVWRLTSVFDLRKGLDIFGATESCPSTGTCGHLPTSRDDGLATATVVRALLYGEYRPIPRLTFALAARGQYAWDRLLSFELFSAGNYTVGRGYDPGTLLGDRGWGTQAEIRFGRTIPPSARKAAVEGYLFYDHAEVDSIGEPLTLGSEHVDSVGGGARVNFDRFRLDASLAVPLTRVGVPAEKPDPRVLITLSTRLYPWTYE